MPGVVKTYLALATKKGEAPGKVKLNNPLGPTTSWTLESRFTQITVLLLALIETVTLFGSKLKSGFMAAPTGMDIVAFLMAQVTYAQPSPELIDNVVEVEEYVVGEVPRLPGRTITT